MYEIMYVTTRVARVQAGDSETAKRRFANYVLYDRHDDIVSDVQLSVGDDAEVSPSADDAPVAGSRDELRAWISDRYDQSEPFEVNCYEDPERSIDSYLRLLATNDPWRLEGHGSLGKTLSAVPMFAQLTTFDRRIEYRFDATQFLDYLRYDVLASLDPARPQESFRIESLVDVSALHDDTLRQIASSYAIVITEFRLTEEFAFGPAIDSPFAVTLDPLLWRNYLEHRSSDPERFLPPKGWVSAFPAYGNDDD